MKEYQRFSYYEEEEAYINEKSSHGYQLKKVEDGQYEFEQKEECNFYRMLLISKYSQEELDSYIQELKEQEIDFVCKDGVWTYFVSKEPFHLYSSQDSVEIYTFLSRTYRNTGTFFLLGSLLFLVGAKFLTKGLYIGFFVFGIVGLCQIYISILYTKKSDHKDSD